MAAGPENGLVDQVSGVSFHQIPDNIKNTRGALASGEAVVLEFESEDLKWKFQREAELLGACFAEDYQDVNQRRQPPSIGEVNRRACHDRRRTLVA